ncbi:monocarboxylate permease [Ilyonectria robusta]
MQQPDEDIELKRLKRLKRHGGYSAAASWLASDPDDEALVFRKFNRLAALNLLYMQSEVLELENRVDAMHLSTVDGHDMGLKDAARTWETLIRQCQPGSEFRLDAKERMDLLLELRKKLKDYHEALALQKDIASLRKPEDRVIEAVKHFFERPQHILGGSAKELFQETKTDGFNDLVALKPRAESDLFSDFLRRH